MATLLLQAAGAYLGGVLGTVGAAVGTAVGAVAGYAIDSALIGGTREREGPRLADPRPFSAEEGASMPRVYGTARIGGNMIWATRFEEVRQTERQGNKGGGERVTTYSYYANAAFALCEGEIACVRRVWADGRELDLTKIDIRVYPGSETQAPDPLIEARQGAGNAPAYRGTAYAVIERFPLSDYGNRVPQFQFEVIRPAGTLTSRIRAMTLIPGSTEYGLSPKRIVKTIAQGESVPENRHVLHAGTDIAAALDELQALCPNLQHVALVVSWFGNDLRAGQCLIRPAVTQGNPAGLSAAWQVSGLTRPVAPVVSTSNGHPAYGGTPSDRSVMDAIATINGRGLKVTLYPFVMMDIAAGNALADPYGGASQPPYPWRGRITCHPAPFQPGSPYATAAARAAIEDFCGEALRTQFVPQGDTVAFTGSASDWGYRRLILHYAHLAASAGGVEAFLIGSELRGLTTLRADNDSFPFVEQLRDLAADVRQVLGGTAKITYGADWTEYFGHQPADDSGDVFFHLDPLWSHPDIDAVGIDNYMPLSDWRDADYAQANPDGFGGPYDPVGLRSFVSSGEGHDWYYASNADRRNRVRSPITDGAHGKPWVFRYKDIKSWWSNHHHDRIGGVEQPGATSWSPGAKPIWFTELGCPAVDKGPNQPNVFPDPKSSENAIPYFSGGGRNDLAPMRLIEAHFDHWDAASPHFAAANNPVSAVYGGRMVDFARFYLWTWDARPFPAFPGRTDVWSDGANWLRGHWLNGRISGVTVGDLVNAILADHELPAADTALADGTLTGYVSADPASARSALEPIMELFGLSARETQGMLTVSSAENGAAIVVDVADPAVEEGSPVVERTRTPDESLPSELALAFREPFSGYQSALVRSSVHNRKGSGQETIGFPGILEKENAESLLEALIKRRWNARETISFARPFTEPDLDPGTIVTVSSVDGGTRYRVIEVEEGRVKRVNAQRVFSVAPPAWTPRIPAVAGQAVPFSSPPLALFLDLPTTSASGMPQDQFRVAARARPWRGQVVLASPEETGFLRRATISQPAAIGLLTGAVGSAMPGRIHRGRPVFVRLLSGELSGVSMLQLLNGANAAAVRSANGEWEVIQFMEAEEIEASHWRLDGLLRGQLGTEDATAAGAPEGSHFVLLDEAVRPAGLKASGTGLELNWRVGPASEPVGEDLFVTQAVAGGVRARLPLAPVHLRARGSTGGDLQVSWIRRGRVDADSWLAPDIPLGEETQAYRVETLVEDTLLREATVSVPQWTYTAGDIATDLAGPATVTITVRQISATVGDGLSARLEVTLG